MAISNKKMQITGFSEEQIIENEELYAYRGNLFEQFLVIALERPFFLIYALINAVFCFALIIAGFGSLAVVLIMLYLGLNAYSKSRQINIYLPDKLPIFYKGKRKDRGDFYFGTEVKTNRQLWKSSSDLLLHTYVLAGSGSGKTATLISIFAINIIAQGSGIWKMDFKGTVELLGQYYNIALRFGRIDCLRVANFNNPHEKGSVLRNSNTSNQMLSDNPYNSWSFLSTFMGDAMSGGGDNQFFTTNAEKIVRSILTVFHELQSKDLLLMSPAVIKDALHLQGFLSLYHDSRISESTKSMLEDTYKSLTLNYKEKGAKQDEDPARLFSNFAGNVDPHLKFLIEVFPQIFEAPMSEVNPADIVTNRRIAVVIAPTASLSASDQMNIAKSSLNLAKNALGVGLGGDFIGSSDRVMFAARNAKDNPYLYAADEYFAALKTDGLGIIAAQARGLGLGAIYSSQDAVAAEETNKLEHGQIAGSTQLKLLGTMKETERSMGLLQPLFPELNLVGKKIHEDQNRNTLTESRNEITKQRSFNVEELFRPDKFPIGRFMCVGVNHITKLDTFFYDNSKFLAQNLRINTLLPVIPTSQHKINNDMLVAKFCDEIDKCIAEAEEQLSRKIRDSSDFKDQVLTIIGKRSFSSYFSELEVEEPDEVVNEINNETDSNALPVENSNESAHWKTYTMPGFRFNRTSSDLRNVKASDLEHADEDKSTVDIGTDVYDLDDTLGTNGVTDVSAYDLDPEITTQDNVDYLSNELDESLVVDAVNIDSYDLELTPAAQDIPDVNAYELSTESEAQLDLGSQFEIDNKDETNSHEESQIIEQYIAAQHYVLGQDDLVRSFSLTKSKLEADKAASMLGLEKMSLFSSDDEEEYNSMLLNFDDLDIIKGQLES